MRAAVRALVVGVLALGLAGCWPVPGHDPDWTGYNDLERAITPATVADLEQRWVWRSSRGFYVQVRSPVTSAGGVHVAAGCELVTLDPGTGAVRWSADGGSILAPRPWLCDYGRTGDPFVIGDRVYAAAELRFPGRPSPGPVASQYEAATASWDVDTGEVDPSGFTDNIALTARRGDVVASVDGMAAWVGTPPFVVPVINNWVVLGSLGGSHRRLPGASDGRVTVGTEAAYVVTGTAVSSLNAYAIDDPELTCGSSGTEECPLWTASLDGWIVGRPVIGDEGATLYVGTEGGTLYALDAATGDVSWTAPMGSAVTESPALAHDTLYVPTASGDLVAVAAGGCGADVCSPAWSASTGSPLTVQPVVAGDVVITGSEDGALRAFDAAGCGEATCPALWSASAGAEVSGMAADGTLYVGTGDARLLAYALP
jgi:outer membrane protein assembly factor BamB